MQWLILVVLLLDPYPATLPGNAMSRNVAAQLQGTWTVVSVASDLGARPKGALEDERIIVPGE